MPDRLTARLATLCAIVACACSPPPAGDPPGARDGAASTSRALVISPADSAALASLPARGEVRAAAPVLDPLAASVADRLVFVPATQRWFLAAARGKRLLVDLGRADLDVRRDAATRAAFQAAAAARSPVPTGARLRLYGPWGSDDADVSGLDVWNGRVVAVLRAPPRVDSLARRLDPLVATAQRLDSADAARTPGEARVDGRPETPPPACRRPLDPVLATRLTVVRDSVEAVLRRSAPRSDRLASGVRSRSSQVVGCFGPERVALVVTLWAGDYEWVQERAMLVDSLGRVLPVRLGDYRFKAHELLAAFDADGDGYDDLAVRGVATRVGGMSVLRRSDRARLTRLASGFAWERQE